MDLGDHGTFLRNEVLFYLDLSKKARLKGDRATSAKMQEEASFALYLLRCHLKDRRMFYETRSKVGPNARVFRNELECALFKGGEG